MKIFGREMRSIALIALSVGLMLVLQACNGSSTVSTTYVPPNPPENYFPAKIGDFTLAAKPAFLSYESNSFECKLFSGIYKKDNSTVLYRVGVFDSAEKAKQSFDAKRMLAYTSEIIKQSGNEITAIQKMNGKAEILRLNNKYVIEINGGKADAVALENSLPYQSFGMTAPPPRKVEEFSETPILFSAMHKEFEKNPADAMKKYSAHFVFLKAKVVEAGDKVETKTIVEKAPTPVSTSYSFRFRTRPSSAASRILRRINKKTPTPTPIPTPKTRQIEKHHPYVVIEIPSSAGGEPLMFTCIFDSSQTDTVKKLVGGTEILFRGLVSFSGDLLKIEDARLDENFW